MTRNEAAERLRWRALQGSEVHNSLLDEALATERRLTVARVRERAKERVIRRGPNDDGGFLPTYELARILDDLATADVDEEAGDG